MAWTHTVEIGYIGSSDQDEERAREIVGKIERPVEGDFPVWSVMHYEPSDTPEDFDTRAEAIRRTEALLSAIDEEWRGILTVGIASG